MVATFKSYSPCAPVHGINKDRPSNAVKMHRSKKKETLSIGAIRSSKTFSHRFQEIKKAWNNPYPDYVTLICGHEYPSVKMSLEYPITDHLLRLGLIESRDAHSYTDHLTTLKNGRQILYRSLDNYDEAIRSLNVYTAFIHEITLCKKEAKDVVAGRLLLTNGQLYMEGTPKGTSNWVYQEYFADQKESEHQNTEYVKYEVYDNPLITKEAVDDLRLLYDPLMARQEIDGEWVNLTADRVYYAFDPQINVREFDERNGQETYKFIDYNVGVNANLTAQFYDGAIWILNEDVGCPTTRDVALRWKQQFADRATNLFVIDDSNSGNASQQGEGKTNRAILQQNGITRIAGTTQNPGRVNRYANTNVWLCNGLGKPHVFIHPRCRKLISELTTLCYKKNSDHPDDMGGKSGHITDALGYGVFYLSGGHAAWEPKSLHHTAA